MGLERTSFQNCATSNIMFTTAANNPQIATQDSIPIGSNLREFAWERIDTCSGGQLERMTFVFVLFHMLANRRKGGGGKVCHPGGTRLINTDDLMAKGKMPRRCDKIKIR